MRQELPSESRGLIQDKLAAMARRLGEERDVARLDVDVEESIAAVRAGSRVRAAGNLAVNGRRYHAEALGETLEGAVDRVRDELAREVRTARGRERATFRRNAQSIKRWLRSAD